MAAEASVMPIWLQFVLPLLTVCAIIAGPIIALSIQRKLDREREGTNRRFWIFRELMVTRASRVSRRHVDALNSIQVEFHGVKEVIEAWQNYYDDYIMNSPGEDADQPAIDAWNEKGNALLIALLFEMSKHLGFDFDQRTIRQIYSPKAHEDEQVEQWVLRRRFLEILMGKEPLPVILRSPEDEHDNNAKLRDGLKAILEGSRAFNVKIINDPTSDDQRE